MPPESIAGILAIIFLGIAGICAIFAKRSMGPSHEPPHRRTK